MAGLIITILVLLLFFPKYSVHGAAAGLTLWFNVVLPTLAPFMICTRLITDCGGIRLLIRPFAPLLKRLFQVSENGAYILLCGLLCGYPLGAKLCSDFLKEERISAAEARYLLALCNHPSPMFLSGYVYSMLPAATSKPLFLCCFYAPLLPLSWLARKYYSYPKENAAAEKRLPSPAPHSPALDDILLSVSETMVLIGNYIMLFSIFAEWAGQIPGIGLRQKALLAGFLEITTGTRLICEAFPAGNVVPIVILATAFGGLSGIFQTKSVIGTPALQDSARPDAPGITENAGLSIRHYVFWKMLSSVCAATCWVVITHASAFTPR